MALPTFAPDPAPSPNPQAAPVVKLRKVEFGDGYTQSSPDGLNHIRETVELEWPALTLAQKDALDAFFRARGGYQSFLYQPWGFSAALKWTCADWSWAGTAPFPFRCKLEQSFTNET